MRHVTATGCCNKSLRVTCENNCRCNKILSLRSVAQKFKLVCIRASYRSDKISASSLVATCVRICDKSPRQNLNQPMREHQLVSRHVKFELVYISSLSKSIACTEQVSYRSDLSQQQCRRGDLSPRCVTAICCIVCLGLKTWTSSFDLFRNSKTYDALVNTWFLFRENLAPSAQGHNTRPNDGNMPTQHIAALLSASCCVRLATMLRHVVNCRVLTIFRLKPTTRNMLQHIAALWPNACNMLRPTMLRWHVAIIWLGLKLKK